MTREGLETITSEAYRYLIDGLLDDEREAVERTYEAQYATLLNGRPMRLSDMLAFEVAKRCGEAGSTALVVELEHADGRKQVVCRVGDYVAHNGALDPQGMVWVQSAAEVTANGWGP